MKHVIYIAFIQGHVLRQGQTIIFCVEKMYLELYKRFKGIDADGVKVHHKYVPTPITLNNHCGQKLINLRFKTVGQKRKDFFVHLLDSTASGRTSMQLRPLIEVTGLLEIQSVKHHLQLSQLLAL